MSLRGHRAGSIIREAESARSYTLPAGMSVSGPCGVCGRDGKLTLDARGTIKANRPVHGYRCADHPFSDA